LSDINLEEIQLSVEPGDRLYLFTDGIIEAWNPRLGIWGSERFYDLLSTLSRVDLEDVCDRVMAAVDQWTESKDGATDARQGQDDIALLSLEITG
jgi:sigma-B regulation protein RsbU (phosphoserine phosphatase)